MGVSCLINKYNKMNFSFSTIDPLDMIATLQVYIHIRKNKVVKIKPPTNGMEYLLLKKLYDYAIEWMSENNCKIRQI